jgi:zinc/manganese transport system permease protein
MAYPFLACLLIAGIHVYLGLHVISRKVIFVDLALAQIAAFGAIYGVILGYDLQEDTWAIKGFSLLFAFLGAGIFSLTRMRHERVPHEAIIGITYAVALAATILGSIHLPHGADEVRSLLAGSILWVRGETILYLALLYIAVGIFYFIYRDRFLLISLDPRAAEDQGINIRFWDFLFYLSFGLVVTNSVAIGGVLLVFSYLVVPAVVAILFAESVASRLIIGWLVGTVVSVVGVVFSYVNDLPSGPTIVVCFAVFLLLSSLVRYVFLSPSKFRSIVYICTGSITLLLFIWFGRFISKDDDMDLHHLVRSSEKNERLMGLKLVEGDSTEWEALLPDLTRLLGDPESEIKVSILSLIGKYGESEMSDKVMEAMTDPDDTVREAAIRCLAEIGDEKIVESLVEIAEEEVDPYLKIEIAELIVDLGEESGLGFFMDVMDDAETSQARKEAYIHLVGQTRTDLPFDYEISPEKNDYLVQRFRERF